MNQTQTAKRDIDILREELTAMTGQFAMALPKQVPVDRFVRVGMTCFQNYPDLMKCSKRSLWNAFMKAAGDGLLPDGREAVILPFKTKVKVGGQEKYELMATYIPMIAGLRKKARNSGLLADWFAEVVCAKDQFDFQRGTDNFVRHKQSLDDDRGPVIAAYSVAFLKDDQGYSFDIMSKSEIDRIRALSKNPEGPGWKGHYNEMAKKTVARRHSKVLPMSTDLDDLLRRDDEVHGSADIPAVSASVRPQLEDFTQSQGSDETAASDDGKAGKEPSGEKAGKDPSQSDSPKQPAKSTATTETSSDTPPHDPETGELESSVKPDVPADDAALAKELKTARLLGKKDRDAGRAHNATPLEYREKGMERHRDEWRAGWKERDEEISKEKAKR